MSTETRTIEELATQEYKYGFVTDVEADEVPRGLNEDIIRLISEKKGEPEWLLEWRLKAYRTWLNLKDPDWANVKHEPIDYQDIVYYSAPKRKKLQSLDEVDPEIRKTFEKLGIPLEEQKALAGRGGGRGVRQRLGRDDVQGQAEGAGDHLLLVLRGGPRAPRAGPQVSRFGRPALRQLLRGAELGGLHRRLVLLRAEGRPLPDGAVDLLPDQRAEHRAVRADADRGRRGGARQLPRRLHGADAGREPAARRGRRARRARQRHHQVLDGAELVSRRQERQGRHLQLRHEARATAAAPTRRSRGRRSRPGRRSPGSTRAASCRATTPWASSIRSR